MPSASSALPWCWALLFASMFAACTIGFVSGVVEKVDVLCDQGFAWGQVPCTQSQTIVFDRKTDAILGFLNAAFCALALMAATGRPKRFFS